MKLKIVDETKFQLPVEHFSKQNSQIQTRFDTYILMTISYVVACIKLRRNSTMLLLCKHSDTVVKISVRWSTEKNGQSLQTNKKNYLIFKIPPFVIMI
jgi:hypothetical protein